MLIWTAALAPIFAVARLVDWSTIEVPTLARWAQFMSLAVLLAVTPLVAIWSGLGSGSWLPRSVIPLVFNTGSGALLALATVRGWLAQINVGFYSFRWNRPDLIELLKFWITWTVLAGFFYLALLLVLRASDHRLIRVRRPRR